MSKGNDNEIPDFTTRLEEIDKLVKSHKHYLSNHRIEDIDDTNKRQKELAATFAPFFNAIHEMLKVIDRKVRNFEKEQGSSKEGKTVKTELDELHKEIKEAEYFFIHINWLQERFPEARYEDVAGLCKLASLEEIEEQDYSLNPGRYVGVVIEEDGKTEEEFTNEILALNNELNKLNIKAKTLEIIINKNINAFLGEDD